MTILDPNFNSLPPVNDWEKVFVALQQANEKVFRGASLQELGKQIVGDVAIQGADFEDLPIATSAAPVALPVPEAEMKFGFLANGTYTQPNGPNLVYTDVQWGLTLFDGTRWNKKFTLTLPKAKDGKDGTLIQIDEYGGAISYSNFTDLIKGEKVTYKNKVNSPKIQSYNKIHPSSLITTGGLINSISDSARNVLELPAEANQVVMFSTLILNNTSGTPSPIIFKSDNGLISYIPFQSGGGIKKYTGTLSFDVKGLYYINTSDIKNSFLNLFSNSQEGMDIISGKYIDVLGNEVTSLNRKVVKIAYKGGDIIPFNTFTNSLSAPSALKQEDNIFSVVAPGSTTNRVFGVFTSKRDGVLYINSGNPSNTVLMGASSLLMTENQQQFDGFLTKKEALKKNEISRLHQLDRSILQSDLFDSGIILRGKWRISASEEIGFLGSSSGFCLRLRYEPNQKAFYKGFGMPLNPRGYSNLPAVYFISDTGLGSVIRLGMDNPSFYEGEYMGTEGGYLYLNCSSYGKEYYLKKLPFEIVEGKYINNSGQEVAQEGISYAKIITEPYQRGMITTKVQNSVANAMIGISSVTPGLIIERVLNIANEYTSLNIEEPVVPKIWYINFNSIADLSYEKSNEPLRIKYDILKADVGNERYISTWGDEFDRNSGIGIDPVTGLDLFKWRYRTGLKVKGNNIKEAIQVSDGTLKILIRPNTTPASFVQDEQGNNTEIRSNTPFTCGGIISLREFKYGLYVARMKMADGIDLHGAFWTTQGFIQSNETTLTVNELDFMEYDKKAGVNNEFDSTLHQWHPRSHKKSATSGKLSTDQLGNIIPDLTQGFNEWAALVNEYGVTIYFNGVRFASLYYNSAFQNYSINPANLLLTSLAYNNASLEGKQEAVMEVDFFRFYEKQF